MQVVRTFAELARLDFPLALAAGVFDGVHLGHRAVIARAAAIAAARSAATAVLTFHPHPVEVLRPGFCPPLLTTRDQKLELVRALGVRVLVELPFTERFAAIPARDFLHDLVAACGRGLAGISVGRSWSFGRGREGGIPMLEADGAAHGYEVAALDPVLADQRAISSTRIRQSVQAGDLQDSRLCLGRDYGIGGTVIEGAKLGRQLGFPTANLQSANEVLPPDGVYAAWAVLGAVRHPAVVNLGCRPTIAEHGRRKAIEAHLLDFSGDLYGVEIGLEFVARMRAEQQFAGPHQLRRQIEADIAQARRLFHGSKPDGGADPGDSLRYFDPRQH